MRPPQPSRARFSLPLAPSPANAREGTRYGSAQAPTPAAPKLSKSERRVICECSCMLRGSQEGADG